jgi:hypothetical protein
MIKPKFTHFNLCRQLLKFIIISALTFMGLGRRLGYILRKALS